MEGIKAVIFDLDNTILDRSETFRNFAVSFVRNWFGHLEETDGLIERIIELDQDGYKEKTALFGELLDELPWKERPGLDELMDFYRKHYVGNATLMDQAAEILQALKSGYRLGLITNVYKIVTDYPKKSCSRKLGISRFVDRLYRERQA